jgi:hypothetical protein
MDEDLKSASDGVAEIEHKPAYSPKHSKKKRKLSKTPLIIILVLILVGSGGFAAWNLLLNKPKADSTGTLAPTKSGNSAASSTPSRPLNPKDTPTEPLTQKYTSTKLNVAFQYPASWKISEANGGLRIESPKFTYNAIDAGDINGNFRIYIRQGARDIDAKYIGHGVAIKPSDKLTYTQPALGQRTSTRFKLLVLTIPKILAFF